MKLHIKDIILIMFLIIWIWIWAYKWYEYKEQSYNNYKENIQSVIKNISQWKSEKKEDINDIFGNKKWKNIIKTGTKKTKFASHIDTNFGINDKKVKDNSNNKEESIKKEKMNINKDNANKIVKNNKKWEKSNITEIKVKYKNRRITICILANWPENNIKDFLNYYNYKNYWLIARILYNKNNKKALNKYWYMQYCVKINYNTKMQRAFNILLKRYKDLNKIRNLYVKYLIKNKNLEFSIANILYKDISTNSLVWKKNLWILTNNINNILYKIWIFSKIEENKNWWINIDSNTNFLINCQLSNKIDTWKIYNNSFLNYNVYKKFRKNNKEYRNLSYLDWLKKELKEIKSKKYRITNCDFNRINFPYELTYEEKWEIYRMIFIIFSKVIKEKFEKSNYHIEF